MSADFFTLLEDQLVAAAERELAASPRERRAAARRGRSTGRRALAVLPTALALTCVALIAAVVLTLGADDADVAGRRVPAPTAPTPPVGVVFPVDADVHILNGTGRDGLADSAARRLDTIGARITGTGNLASTAVSRVYYAKGRFEPGSIAAAAARLTIGTDPEPLPDALRSRVPGGGIVVVLGTDFDRRTGMLNVTLKGPGGARGMLTLRETTTDRRLDLDAAGIASTPTRAFAVWAESRSGTAIFLGGTAWDGISNGRIYNSLPHVPASIGPDPRRFFVTAGKGRFASESSPADPIVLDSGRLR